MKKKASKRYKKLIKTYSNNKGETLEVAIKKIVHRNLTSQ